MNLQQEGNQPNEKVQMPTFCIKELKKMLGETARSFAVFCCLMLLKASEKPVTKEDEIWGAQNEGSSI